MIADFDARFWYKLPFTVRQGEATCLWRPRVWFSNALMTELDCVKLHILWTCWRHVADAAAAGTSAMECLCAPNGVSDIAGTHSNHVVSILVSSATIFHQRTYVVGMALYPALAAPAWYIDLAHRFPFILRCCQFSAGKLICVGLVLRVFRNRLILSFLEQERINQHSFSNWADMRFRIASEEVVWKVYFHTLQLHVFSCSSIQFIAFQLWSCNPKTPCSTVVWKADSEHTTM